MILNGAILALCGCVRQAMLRLSKDYHERVVEEEGKTQVSARVPTADGRPSESPLPGVLEASGIKGAASRCARAVVLIACTFVCFFFRIMMGLSVSLVQEECMCTLVFLFPIRTGVPSGSHFFL